MTPSQLKIIIIEMYGSDNGGQRKLAADLLVHEVTVCRWVAGTIVMEPQTERLILLLYHMHKEKIRWRKAIKELTLNPVSLEAFI